MKYKNVHTKEVVEITKIDIISPNTPFATTVYELNNGTRWNINLFTKHFKEEESESNAATS